jgi:two-component system, cell cycle sensor histidine kinase and response regulator CckA
MQSLLIVDNNEKNLYFLETLLQAHGFQTLTASNGEQALAMARKELPILIISNILTPVMDGFILCRHCKQDPILREVPFILYTADYYCSDPIGEALAPAQGPELFILKPANPKVFMEQIRWVLNKYNPWQLTESVPNPKDEPVLLTDCNTAPIGKLENKLTELERINEALRKNEEKYRLIIDYMADTIWIMDMNMRFTYISPSIIHLRGYTVEEAIEQTLDQMMTPDSLQVVLKVFEEEMALEASGIAEPDRTRTLELEEYKKDGSTVWVDNSLSFLRDNNNKATAILGVTRDITERKRAEQENTNLQEQFRQAQKMEAVGRLAGGVAHDFNNLLSIILGYGEIIMEELSSGHPHHELLKEIYDAGMRAKNLTRQLLLFSRKQSLQIKVVDVNALVAGFKKMLRRIIGEDIRLELMLTSDKTIVKADMSQLEQVLMNLAVNARDAMEDGGVLAIETDIIELDDLYASKKPNVVPGKYVMIALTDTGIGMDHETLDHIFEPFFTTKGKNKGTGLGLATTYGIIKKHGGNIWVYTEPGQGTTFKIYLPLVSEEVTPKSEPHARIESVDVAATILVVEDDPAVRKIACSILGGKGYKVLDSGVPEKAVDIARNHKAPIHLLVSDIVMPGMKGPQVYEKISKYHPDIKVLYMSGYSESSILHYGIDADNAEFIQKPLTVKSLLVKVANMLNLVKPSRNL